MQESPYSGGLRQHILIDSPALRLTKSLLVNNSGESVPFVEVYSWRLRKGGHHNLFDPVNRLTHQNHLEGSAVYIQ